MELPPELLRSRKEMIMRNIIITILTYIVYPFVLAVFVVRKLIRKARQWTSQT